MTPKENKTSDAKQCPSPIKDSKVIISPAEINYQRKVTLKDADIDKDTKKQLETLWKTDLVQMTLQPKNSTKPLDQKPNMLPLWYDTWLQQELNDVEKAGIISPSTSNFAGLDIIVSKKKDPTTYEITYRMVVNFR